MKKLITILLFSVFCFGMKATEIINANRDGSQLCMKVLQKGEWVYFHSDHGDIWFDASRSSNSNGDGSVEIEIRNDRDEDYKRLQKMMNEIKSKTKMTVDYTQSGCDGNGIIHKEEYSYYGYRAYFVFHQKDIDTICLY